MVGQNLECIAGMRKKKYMSDGIKKCIEKPNPIKKEIVSSIRFMKLFLDGTIEKYFCAFFVHTLIVMGNSSIASDYEDCFCMLIALIGILYYVRTARSAAICDKDYDKEDGKSK